MKQITRSKEISKWIGGKGNKVLNRNGQRRDKKVKTKNLLGTVVLTSL